MARHGEETLIGQYGDWARRLVDRPPSLSLRRTPSTDIRTWREETRNRVADLLVQPARPDTVEYTVEDRYEDDGLHIEELRWELPYGPPTRAVLLKPVDVDDPLPGVLALHDHGGKKYLGRRKVAATDRLDHPVAITHRDQLYEGHAWARELAKRGYVVLAPDAFAFASRRVRVDAIPEDIKNGIDEPRESCPESIDAYDEWAASHESIMAKSLFCAGTTWPGVTLSEDRYALDILCSRADVDADRVGCGGLSGGGLRTVYLGGIDPRIESAVCVGMMTTWTDYLCNTAWTHTWMIYLPGGPAILDYPEILGLRVPQPTLVLNNRQDPLFTMEGMQRADEILTDVYAIADAEEAYRASWYDGGHKFDREMQDDAFEWFDSTL